jgi:uncharacterized protein
MIQEQIAGYVSEIEAWRAKREASLRAPDGWLSLAGLFMLEEGEYTLGSGDDNRIVLPPSAPAHLGILTFHQGKASLTVTTDVPVLVNGLPTRSADLVDNNGQQPSLVSIGSVTFFVHKFGNEYALRVRDSANPSIQDFEGCVWYEVKPNCRVPGRVVPHNAPVSTAISTVVNTVTDYTSVGTVEFVLHGQPSQLLAKATATPNQLFIVFRDATAGKETYGACRFLNVMVDGDGNTVVDFNKAYNPPCAFTPYATCPLPPRANILPVAIEAGERV